MQIYLDLFFNNIESFLANAFPIAKQVLGDETWLETVREFVHLHGSQSPYFLQISEEFLAFLSARDRSNLPDYILELCHYEWIELAVDVAEDPVYPTYDSAGDLMGRQLISQAMRVLTYTYPVHQIGPGNVPGEPPSAPTHLIVYRSKNLRVHFMESNAITHRLLALLEESTGIEAVDRLTQELNQAGRSLATDTVRVQAVTIIEKFRDVGIVLGTV